MISSRGLSTCRMCFQQIRWTTTDAGERMPVNPVPDPAGNTAVYRDGLGVWRSRRPTTELPIAPFEKLHMPHAATCARSASPASEARLPTGVISLTAVRRSRRGRRTS